MTNRSIKIHAVGFDPPILIGPEREAITVWMEAVFNRKKGEYFSHSEFGTSIVPDSNKMVRCSNITMMD